MMFRLWYETVHGWKVFGDYDTKAEAVEELRCRVSRAYVVLMGGAMGREIVRNW